MTTMTTTERCYRHQTEPAEAICAACDAAYCPPCLVYVRGPKKPPLCLECALGRSGIRAGSNTPRLGWRQRRLLAKARKRAAAARAAEVRRTTDALVDESDQPDIPQGWSPYEPEWVPGETAKPR